jgi:hypothetical protein
MTDEERARILAEALATIERCDREAADLAERQAHNLVRVDRVGEREAFLRRRAAHPPSPAPRLDTAPPDLDERIAAEHEYWHAILPELIAAERADADAKIAKLEARISTLETLERELERRALDYDVVEKLSDTAQKLQAQMVTVERCLGDLRATVANEAQRGSATVFDLPSFRYPRDLN